MSTEAEEKNEGHFVLKKKTAFKDMADGIETTLPESDLSFQSDTHVFQFKFIEAPEERRREIVPGIFSLTEEGGRVVAKKTELRGREILTSIVNTSAITNEAQVFFSKLHIYKMLGEQEIRKLLIYSDPGMGKTATITHFCKGAIEEDAGTVVIVWPTADIAASDVSDFFNKQTIYNEKCTRLILIMEDIGGNVHEGHGGPRRVDSGLLELLDGLQVTFKLPTFIIATTNYPQNLLSALADRPGRFDLMMQLKPPSYDEKLKLLEFIAKRELTDEEKLAFKSKDTESFSIAHLKEVIIRSMLHDKAIKDVVKELVEHRKRFERAFEEKNKVGLGFGDD